MPKVSVIIPIYGVEKYIERCARSLFEQTLDDIEYLFIDDVTPDKSIDILKQVLVEYPFRKKQVVIHRMDTNSGQAAVRKWGIQNATGDFVIHCDSDDWIDVDMYRVMYEKAIREEADVVVCDFNYTDGISYKRKVKACFSDSCDEFVLDMLYQKISWAVWNKLIRKELCSSVKVFPLYAMGEDMVTIILSCEKISYVENAYYNYYFNPNSIMNTLTREQCMNKYLQLKGNTELLLPLLKNSFTGICYRKIEKVLRYNKTIPLLTYIYEKNFFILWKSEMKSCYSLIFDCNVKKIFKLMYVLVMLRIYPLYKCWK